MAYERFCDDNDLDIEELEAQKTFWTFVCNQPAVWLLLDLVGAPPDIDGLDLQQGVEYMKTYFPYPLMEYVHEKLVKFDYLFHGDRYNRQGIGVAFPFASPTITARSKSNSYLLVVPSMRFLLDAYEIFKGLFGDITKKFSAFYVCENVGNIVIVLLSYSAVSPPLCPDGCRVMKVKNTEDCKELIAISLFQVGEWDASVIISDPSIAAWRACLINYGICTQDDFKEALCLGRKLKRLETLQNQLELSESKCKPIYDDALYLVQYIASGQRIGIFDCLYIKCQCLNASEEMWRELCCIGVDCQRPVMDDRAVADAIQFIHYWVLNTFKRSAVLFILHFLTFLTADRRKRMGFWVLGGIPFAGKSTFVRVLQALFVTHRMPNIREDFDKQLAYSKGKTIVIVDDASAESLDNLSNFRTVIDGQPIVSSQKYAHDSEFVPPPLLWLPRMKRICALTYRSGTI